jgi:glycosyltransferase involved in cell wall biosynthesis
MPMISLPGADRPRSAAARRPVVMHWSVSSFSGWGIYGLNLALLWSGDKDIEPLSSRTLQPDRISVDPLRRRALAPFLQGSLAFQNGLASVAGQQIEVINPLLAAVNADFVIPRAVHDVCLVGHPTIGVTFFETAQLTPDDVSRARQFPLIVTGSTWNQRVLAAYGITSVKTVHQGIDPALFHLAPTAGVMDGRFCVFSGGKLEFRKGQDIALAAFARFARRHPEALLVVAWHNPWPALVRSLDASPALGGPVPVGPDGSVDVAGWVRAAGVPAGQFLDLGAVPNASLPAVLREMDVAIFPNRCEGGTNLVAMECMACGVPTVLSANTGHLDLIDGDNCYVLQRQAPLTAECAGVADVPGWGESSVPELAEVLERVFSEKTEAVRRGRQGAETAGRLTWARTAAQMKQLVFDR